MKILCCLFVCLPILTYSSLFNSPVGPYVVLFKRFENCTIQGTKEMMYNLHLKRINRTTVVVYGNIILKRDLDHSTKMRNEFSVWGNGGWRANAQNVDFDRNICRTLLNILGKTWENYWANARLNITKTDCIIPANNYRMGDFVASNWHFKTIPIMVYGLYRISTSFYTAQDELMGCVRTVIEIMRRY